MCSLDVYIHTYLYMHTYVNTCRCVCMEVRHICRLITGRNGKNGIRNGNSFSPKSIWLDIISSDKNEYRVKRAKSLFPIFPSTSRVVIGILGFSAYRFHTLIMRLKQGRPETLLDVKRKVIEVGVQALPRLNTFQKLFLVLLQHLFLRSLLTRHRL